MRRNNLFKGLGSIEIISQLRHNKLLTPNHIRKCFLILYTDYLNGKINIEAYNLAWHYFSLNIIFDLVVLNHSNIVKFQFPKENYTLLRKEIVEEIY